MDSGVERMCCRFRCHDGSNICGWICDRGATGGSDAFLAAFDSDGSLLWYRRRETNGVEGDTARRVCATPDSVYLLVIGSKGWTLKTITKFDPKGNQRWDQRLEDDRIYNDLKYFNDYLYAAGTLNNDALIAKLDLEGRILWNKTIGKPDREDYAAGIFLDKNHIYVVGTTESYTKWSQRIAFLNIYRIIK
ncbi:MAG: hypothetical protein QW638_03290 [Candidatus Bathyarchaeia archaeon]